MKKILIISDGAIGEHFIDRIISIGSSENSYYIIHSQPKTFDSYNSAKFKFFHFDPTSYYKLADVLKNNFVQAMLMIENREDLNNSIINIKTISPRLRIVALDLLNNDDCIYDDIEWINARELISANMIDNLPNIPVLAKNIGLGSGEIMEVLVPFGSSFVYRHVGSIEQKNWQIAAIYRNRQLVLPSEKRMIQPNDSLVLVGEPSVLKSIYRVIKRELGQFPEPFGSKIYLYIDMDIDKTRDIMALLRRALFIKKKLRKPLVIKVINPTDTEILRILKSASSDDIDIDITYMCKNKDEVILNDTRFYHIGLFLVSHKVFSRRDIRKKLYYANVPVLKLSNRSFSALKESVVVLNENGHTENISTTVFDVSAQFGFNIELVNYTGEDDRFKPQMIEQFENLSTIFSKMIRLESIDLNPIRALKDRDNFLQILPYTPKIYYPITKRIFSTDAEVLHQKLSSYHQLFVPMQI